MKAAIRFVCFSMSIVTIACAQKPTTGKTWAMLVGVNRYENSHINELQYSVPDVKALGAEFQNVLGVKAPQLKLMTSDADKHADDYPTSVHIVNQLTELAQEIQPEDTFIFVFSGHGFNRDGVDYLGSVNADNTSTYSLQISAVPMDLLAKITRQIKAHRVLFILDACRTDPEKTRGDSDHLLDKDLVEAASNVIRSDSRSPSGSAVLFACSIGERAYEWPEHAHGVFTYYLIQGLRGGAYDSAGELTVSSLFEFVQQNVIQWGKNKLAGQKRQQTPYIKQEGVAKFVLRVGKPTNKTTTETVSTRAELTLTSDPPGAVVFVDGKEQVGKPTPCKIDFDLGGELTKEITVSATLDGYKAQPIRITLEPGRVANATVAMTRSVDTIRIPAPLPGMRFSYEGLDRVGFYSHKIQGGIPFSATSVAFSPDGRTFGAAGSPIGAEAPPTPIWDAASGELIRAIQFNQSSPYRGGFLTIAFSRDAKSVIGVEDKSAVSFEVAKLSEGEPAGAINVPQTYGMGLAFSRVEYGADSRLYVSGSIGGVVAYSLETGKSSQVVEPIPDQPEYLPSGQPKARMPLYPAPTEFGLVRWTKSEKFDVSADASMIAIRTEILSTKTDQRNIKLEIPISLATEVAAASRRFSPDGSKLVVGTTNQLIIFDAKSGRIFASRNSDDAIADFAYSPDGRTIGVLFRSSRVELRDATSLQLIEAVKQPLAVSLCFHPSLPWIAIGLSDGRVAMWRKP